MKLSADNKNFQDDNVGFDFDKKVARRSPSKDSHRVGHP
jgi:hypothetical protein